jgi:hypothetical protein
MRLVMRHGLEASAVLPAELARHKVLRARLLADIPDIDPETLADTLEGLTDLREMLAEVLRSALHDEAIVAGLSARLADMKVRLDRLKTRAQRKRQLVLQAMTEAEIAKLAEADFTASLRQGPPALEVIAEDQIPAAYWKPAQARPPGPFVGPQGRDPRRRGGARRPPGATQLKDQVNGVHRHAEPGAAGEAPLPLRRSATPTA